MGALLGRRTGNVLGSNQPSKVGAVEGDPRKGWGCAGVGGGGHPLAYHHFHTHSPFGNTPQPQDFCFLWGPVSSSAPSQSQGQGWYVWGFSLAQPHFWQFMVCNLSVGAVLTPQ